jgi:hypothetical protein
MISFGKYRTLRNTRQSRGDGITLLLLALLTALFTPCPAMAAEKARSGAFSLVFENDHFHNTDRHYTNGINLGWLPADTSPPKGALVLIRHTPFFPQDSAHRHGYSFGQSTFTPDDINLNNPPTDDRPYAGWLYGSIHLESGTEQQLDQLVLTLGVVGPASLAELGQKTLHKARAVSKPRGWGNQLENELGMVITYQRNWRVLTSRFLDLTPHAGAALGNIFTYANSGLTLRTGRNLPPDYGPPRIQPGIPGAISFAAPDGFSWYLFAGVEGRAIARNIFLDGNTFRSSRSVDKEVLVGDLQFGAVLTWRKARLSYTHVLRTNEFKSQRHRDGFGAIALTVAY